jgi:hypothetical protein
MIDIYNNTLIGLNVERERQLEVKFRILSLRKTTIRKIQIRVMTENHIHFVYFRIRLSG